MGTGPKFQSVIVTGIILIISQLSVTYSASVPADSCTILIALC